VSVDKEAGGGEYPGQDGFGWTNGVLMKLISVLWVAERIGVRCGMWGIGYRVCHTPHLTPPTML